MPRGDSDKASRSSGGRRMSQPSVPAPALASHLNAAVMSQQLGKSSTPQCVPAAHCMRTVRRLACRPVAPRRTRLVVLTRANPWRNPRPGDSVPRGRNWAPSSDDSDEDDAPRNAAAKRGGNPFQPLLDVMFKPVAELLCPMLMPASNDTLVREYCEELEKDRSVLAQQNVALEKELEKLKLSAAKRQRGKRTKDEQLDRFLDMRVMVRRLGPQDYTRAALTPRCGADEQPPRQRYGGRRGHQGTRGAARRRRCGPSLTQARARRLRGRRGKSATGPYGSEWRCARPPGRTGAPLQRRRATACCF